MSDYLSRVRLWYNDDVARRAITAADASNEYLYVAGDHTADYPVGGKFRVKGSTGNDGEWTVSAVLYISSNTRITVTGNITSGVADGYVHMHAIVAATIATSTLSITGNHTAVFYAGRTFSVSNSTGNNGGHVVVSSTFTSSGGGSSYACGHTDIVVNGTVLNATADGTIDRHDCLTYEMGANALPTHSLPGQRITDRLGLVHRVMPVTNYARYVNGVQINLPEFDIDILSTEGNMLSEFLRTHCILADHELELFSEHASVDQSDNDYSFKRAYKIKMEDLPAWLYSNQAIMDKGAQDITLEAFCVADGVFTKWNDITTTTYRSKPT